MTHIRADYQLGTEAQARLLPKLAAFFADDLKPTLGQYDRYDYESDTAVYELKTRRNEKDTYPTTCIGADKVDPKHPKSQVYLFEFTNGTFYIRYNKTTFDTFERKPFVRNAPGFVEKPYLFIPVTALQPIP